MKPFDDENNLDLSKFALDAQQVIIKANQLTDVSPTRSLRCKPGHFLLALWPTLCSSEEWRDAIESGLSENCPLNEIPKLIAGYIGDYENQSGFEMKRDCFDKNVVRALESCDCVEDDTGNIIWEAGDSSINVLPLWVAILNNPSKEDIDGFGSILDFDQAAEAFVQILIGGLLVDEEAILSDLYSQDGTLQLEYFDDAAVAIFETARMRARGLGYDSILPPHLFLALLERSDGITEKVLRRQAKPGLGPKAVSESLIRAITRGPGTSEKELAFNKFHLSHTLQSIIDKACILARKNGVDTIAERFLLQTVLEAEREGIVGRILSSEDLDFNVDILIRDVKKLIRDYKLGRTHEEVTPFLIPGDVAKSQDLTYLARTRQLKPSVGQDDLIEVMLRGLHKRQNNSILITGEPGVGKTELVRELSRRVGEDQIPFLKRKKIVWVDCDGVPPDQSRDRFYDILDTVKGRRDVIVCLDHFENIVRYYGGNESHNRTIIRVALRSENIRLIAIIDTRHYIELLSHDFTLLEMFSRVEVKEVSPERAAKIIKQVSVAEFEQLYGVAIEDRAIDRATQASQEFIMSERLPVKAIKVIRDACERVYYDNKTTGKKAPIVKDKDVVITISERTGIDEGTIAGSGSGVDYRDILERSVVGQEKAVEVVSERLTRIKAGATREGKPAAVMLFAGLTGTGKTELAKAIARVYSASGKLSVYPMTNFTEAHSISGITGVPAGYVGYDSGGRLINDLNADPYGIVLFDEAEKAHPDIWQAMLSLFDEAWIEDRRNVKAYGNRAIFILTSNAGQEFIRKNYKMDSDKLKEEVSQRLIEHKNPKGERVFSPEFLGRFSDIVIFNPLSEEAMKAITFMQTDQLVKEWETKRGKKLIIDDSVIDYVAGLSFSENERFSGTRGGRIVAKYIGSMIEIKLINLMVEQADAFADAESVRVSLDQTENIVTRIEYSRVLHPSAALEQVNERLQSIKNPDFMEVVNSTNLRVKNAVEYWGRHVAEALPSEDIERVKKVAASAVKAIVEKAKDLDETFLEKTDILKDTLREVSPKPSGTDTNGDSTHE